VSSFAKFSLSLSLALGCLVPASGCNTSEPAAEAAPEAAHAEASKAGASKGFDCAAAVAKKLECAPEVKGESRDQLIAECSTRTAAAGTEGERARKQFGACLAEKTCAEYTRCKLASASDELRANQTVRAKMQLTKLKELAASASWTDAAEICAVFADAAADSADFKTTCDGVARDATKALTAELLRIRDSLGPEDTVVRCVDLEKLARKVSPEAEAQAVLLCRELGVVRRVNESKDAVTKALAGGAGEVPFQCGWAIQDLQGLESPWATRTLSEVKKACNEELPRQLLDVSKTSLAAMRDSGATAEGFSKCFDFKRLARTLGSAAEESAKALCDEVDVAGDVKKALDEAKAASEKQAEELPFLCDYTIGRLEKLTGSTWAKDKAQDLARACYVDAGRSVLQKKLPGMKVGCDFQVQKVYDGARKFALVDPSVDALLLQAETKCKR
jgi:hypothetical protein